MAKTRQEMLELQKNYARSHIIVTELATLPEFEPYRNWLTDRDSQFAHIYSAEDDSFHNPRFQETLHLIAVAPDPEREGKMKPIEDRVVVAERDHFHGVAYDIDENGTYWILGVYQFRPYIRKDGPPVICFDIPMGFAQFGKGSEALFRESTDDAAKREMIEELGLPIVDPPVLLRTMIDHTTYAGLTRTPVYKVRVNRDLCMGKTDEAEALMSEAMTLAEYGRRVRQQIDEDGIHYGFGLSQGTFSCFLADEGEAAIRQFFGI